MTTAPAAIPASFRDPAGYVYLDNGVYKRAVTPAGLDDYRQFIACGLYEDLAGDGLIVCHREEPLPAGLALVPDQIPYVSYPYEWSFSQYKDAALLTLEIQRRALARGMTLKDASPFNVQFRGARPVLIDSLSFETNRLALWKAYHQFCCQFLAPLLLMASVEPDFNQYLSAAPEGFPLATASRLLPLSTWLNAGALFHIHLHARAKGGAGAQPHSSSSRDIKPDLTRSLRDAIVRLRPAALPSPWAAYYTERVHYPPQAEQFRRRFVTQAIRQIQPRLVFDLGANRGDYSRLAASLGARCVSFESDAACADTAYVAARREGAAVLPLRLDLRAPSPAIGFACRERMGLLDRPKADLILALAFIHHMRFTAQAPLARIASFFAQLGESLILEFVPREDPMVVSMLSHRGGDFPDYTMEGMHEAFGPLWQLVDAQPVPSTCRTLCLFRKRA